MDEAREAAEKKQVEDTTARAGDTEGPFQLGRHFEEVSSGLGQLYEARHAETGSPALLLKQGEGAEWPASEPWRVRLSYEPSPATVTLEVEQAPASMPVPELTNMLVLMGAAVERVEDNPRVRTHLAVVPVSASRRWARRARSLLRPKVTDAFASLALLLSGLGLCIALTSRPGEMQATEPDRFAEALVQAGALHLVNSTQPGTATIAYPLPSKPFNNQAVAPCYPELGEEQINGGCWVELAKRPPCLPKTQAEYQGKCFLPISKDRDRGERPRQSAQP